MPAQSSPPLPKIPQLISLKAPFWADSGHLQTLCAHFIPSKNYSRPTQELTIPLQDGDALKAYYSQGQQNVIVCIFHGLGGDITSDYMQRTAELSADMGLGVLLVNHRGAQSGAGLAKNPYHSGRGEDVSDVLAWIRQKYPGQLLITVGVSMSGCILLNLVTGRRGTEKPDGVITVNAPLNLEKGSILLSKGFNRVYDFRFVRKLDRQIKQKKELGLLTKTYPVPLFTTVHDFDDIYTAPASGFKNREHYYESCSPHGYLDQISRPTIMLHSFDDPFVPVEDYLSAKTSSFVQLHIEERGGHVGYYSGQALPLQIGGKTIATHRWLDYFLSQALQRLLATFKTSSSS
jgi:predicted alpha/beta-fold hydrolase